MARLQDRYKNEIVKQLAEKFGRTNPHSLPQLQKIVVNMGVGKACRTKTAWSKPQTSWRKSPGKRPR